MTTNDIEILENKIFLSIPDSKTHKRLFPFVSQDDAALFRKYVALQLSHVNVTHGRIFV